MTATVGIDFSLKALHVATLKGRELIGPFEHRLGKTATSQSAVITKLAMDLERLYGHVDAWLERPWLGLNTQTLIDLSLLVGAVRGVFLASGHYVHLVAPNAWRAGVMLPAAGRDRKAQKAAAVRTVQLEYGRTVDDNEADSILIAKYGAALGRREALAVRR